MVKPENRKYCPLLSITAEDSLVDCQGEMCAWWIPPVCTPNGEPINEGRCAVQTMGLAAPELVQGVRQI